MEASNRFGVLSVYFGITGLLATIGITEAERVRIPGFGHLLTWMDRLGLVRPPPPDQAPEWRPRGLLDLSDDRVLQWILVYSVCFAIWAMLMALLAEHQHEESSSLGLGFILERWHSMFIALSTACPHYLLVASPLFSFDAERPDFFN